MGADVHPDTGIRVQTIKVIPIETSKAVRKLMKFGGNKRGPVDCAYCRHSGTDIVSGQFIMRCRKAMPIMHAEHCPEFRDSRDPAPNHHLPYEWTPD